DRAAYGRLCRLLTLANRAGEKGKPLLTFANLLETPEGAENFTTGQLFILIPDEQDWAASAAALARLVAAAPGAVWVAGVARHAGTDRARLHRLAQLARQQGVPLLASNDVLYHQPDRRMVQD